MYEGCFLTCMCVYALAVGYPGSVICCLRLVLGSVSGCTIGWLMHSCVFHVLLHAHHLVSDMGMAVAPSSSFPVCVMFFYGVGSLKANLLIFDNIKLMFKPLKNKIILYP